MRPIRIRGFTVGRWLHNCNHNLDFALAIRTMLIDENQVDIEAGCGVVYDSIPEKELEETKLKAKVSWR